MANHFMAIETAIRTCFLSALLGSATPISIPSELRTLLSLSVKSTGVGIPNLTDTADNNHTTSSVCTFVVTDSLLNGASLVIIDHKAAMCEGQTASQSSKQANSATALRSLLIPMNVQDAQKTTRNSHTGAWISVQPTLVNRLSLSKDEWRDGMQRRYKLGLVDLPHCCNGCGAKLSIEHALACKK